MATIKPVYSMIPDAPKIATVLGGVIPYNADATADVAALHGTSSVLGGPVGAVATFTVTDTDVLQNKTIIITTTDATVITATETAATTTSDTDSPTFEASTGSSGSKKIAAATNIASCLNANSKLTATSDGAVVTVTQVTGGTDGNSTTTGTADGSGCNTTTDFAGGQESGLEGYDESDEAIEALVAGYATDAAEAKKLEHARKVVLGYI